MNIHPIFTIEPHDGAPDDDVSLWEHDRHDFHNRLVLADGPRSEVEPLYLHLVRLQNASRARRDA